MIQVDGELIHQSRAPDGRPRLILSVKINNSGGSFSPECERRRALSGGSVRCKVNCRVVGATAGLSSSGFGLRRFALLGKLAVAPASVVFATLQIS